MLEEHHGDRPLLARHPASLQLGEQQVLLFPVVTGVGEQPEEGDAVVEGVEIPVAPLPLLEHGLQDVEDLEDDLVFVSQHASRC